MSTEMEEPPANPLRASEIIRINAKSDSDLIPISAHQQQREVKQVDDDPPMKNFCLYFIRTVVGLTVLMLLVALSVFCLHMWISYEASAVSVVEKIFIFASDIGLALFAITLMMAEIGRPRMLLLNCIFVRQSAVRGCALLWMGAILLGTAVQGEVIAQGAVAEESINDDARKSLLSLGYIGGWGCVAMGVIHLIFVCVLPASFDDGTDSQQKRDQLHAPGPVDQKEQQQKEFVENEYSENA